MAGLVAELQPLRAIVGQQAGLTQSQQQALAQACRDQAGQAKIGDGADPSGIGEIIRERIAGQRSLTRPPAFKGLVSALPPFIFKLGNCMSGVRLAGNVREAFVVACEGAEETDLEYVNDVYEHFEHHEKAQLVSQELHGILAVWTT